MLCTVLLLWTVYIPPLAAQDSDDIWFRNFGLQDGLPSKKVNDFVQGPQGFLWIATLDGLVRYDGYEFQSHRVPPENGFPVGNSTDRLIKAPDGKIWVSYWYSSYISYYDTEAHRFASINLKDHINLPSDVEVTRLLGADQQNDIWASVHPSGSEHSILIKIDGETQSIYPLRKKMDTGSLQM